MFTEVSFGYCISVLDFSPLAESKTLAVVFETLSAYRHACLLGAVTTRVGDETESQSEVSCMEWKRKDVEIGSWLVERTITDIAETRIISPPRRKKPSSG